MMTSSNGNNFRVTGPLCGEFTGPGEFPTQRPVTRSFDVFFDLRLDKRLNKQSWGWWFETLSRPFWRHRNVWDVICEYFEENWPWFNEAALYKDVTIDWYVSCVLHLVHQHDDVIKWKQFPRCWPFVREIHRSPVNSPHKGQWRGALMFSWFWVWINGWANNRKAGDLRRYRAHYDVIVMLWLSNLEIIPRNCRR